MVPQQVSFVERLSLSQRVPYRRFHCILLTERGGRKGGGGGAVGSPEEGDGATLPTDGCFDHTSPYPW